MKILSLMFHSVGCNNYSFWNRNHLSVSLAAFERFCNYLHKQKYKTIFLDEWYEIINNQETTKSRYIVLTFDDGYLDNWVYVYPVLKKYGLKSTVFINPEFVNELSEEKRPQFTDNNFDLNNVENILGFLNWNEIIEMDNSENIDIQSHSLTHNRYFSSGKIIDIYTGQDKYDWLAWNEIPDRKPHYIFENHVDYVKFGYPVFENDRSLTIRRYFPDQKLIEESLSLYENMYNMEHSPENAKIDLVLKLNELVERKYPGSFETDEEMQIRYQLEIFESKKILENKLNKKIEFLCWPGGGLNELSYKIAVKSGYKAATHPNEIDSISGLKSIPRIGMGCSTFSGNRRVYLKSENTLVNSLRAIEGHLFDKIKLRFGRLFANYS